jgi:hypothetical protein
MSALSAHERVQHGALTNGVTASIRALDELPDGYRFILDDSVSIADVGAWISLEARCCPFLRFVLDVAAGVVSLELRGAEGVKEFIRVELGLAVKR